MKIIEPSIEFVKTDNLLKKIRLAYAVCYKNENKIAWESCREWIERIIKNGHTSPCEHVRIKVPASIYEKLCKDFSKKYGTANYPYGFNSRIGFDIDNEKKKTYVNMNARDYLALGGKLNELKNYEEAKDYATIKIICNRGISHELVRHREMSFTQESTRYCNYSGEMKFITQGYEKEEGFKAGVKNLVWKFGCRLSEILYNILLKLDAKPQEARSLLNNSLKTEIWVTGTYQAWNDFFVLRDAKGAHPQMRDICKLILNNPDCPPEIKEYYKR